MHFKFSILCFILPFTAALRPPLFYPLTRRGESFPAPEIANLTYLLSVLDTITARFNATILQTQAPSLPIPDAASFSDSLRIPRPLHGTQASSILLGDVGLEGSWFASLKIGTPAQEVDMDIDMLAAEWWVLSTKSRRGSWFLDLNSGSYRDSEQGVRVPTCRQPSDVVHLPTGETNGIVNKDGMDERDRMRDVEITFAHCRPVKQWVRALLPSGAHLGVAPGEGLRQAGTKGLFAQLLERKVIDQPVFSLRVVSGTEGILTIGGVSVTTPQKVGKIQNVQEVLEGSEVIDERVAKGSKGKELHQVHEIVEVLGDIRANGEYTAKKNHEIRDEEDAKERHELRGTPENKDNAPTDQPQQPKEHEVKHQATRRDGVAKRVISRKNNLEEESSEVEWKWNAVSGPVGWWQTKLSTVWVDGRKALQTQPAILDINTPFILAPPAAVQTLYASIFGSRRLPFPNDQFYVYPCLKPPIIDIEIGQDWKVRVLKGKRDRGTFSPGGRFSLGRMGMGSGYCVGIIVESRLGISSQPSEEVSGLEGLWVLGEPFFRDCEVAFDWKNKNIGFRKQ